MTVTYTLRAGTQVIGVGEMSVFDDGMGVATGLFSPTPAYEEVRPIFRVYATLEANLRAAEGPDGALQEFYRRRDALRPEFIDEKGRIVPAGWVMELSSTARTRRRVVRR